MTTSWEDQKSSAAANKGITLVEEHIQVSDTRVFVRSAVDSTLEKPARVFLFLHGMKFSSQTWLELGTLSVMADNGYKAIAVDLPGRKPSYGVHIRGIRLLL